VSTTPAIGASPNQPATAEKPHFLADVYNFDWTGLRFRLALASTVAVAICLIVGVAIGHPGGALIAGGGALTVGFGVNQCIADSRILPMLAAIFAISTATFAGTVVGHSGYELVIAAAVSAGVYGILTVRHAGLAWVGQQASIALFVASAFPQDLFHGLQRAGIIALGGTVQIILTTLALRFLPGIRASTSSSPCSQSTSLRRHRSKILKRVSDLPSVLPTSFADPDRAMAIRYAIRLSITVGLASELYHRMGIQSGYWVPMTALLVQKPVFSETLGRGLARVSGTILGATLATLIAAHLNLSVWALVFLTAFFAFWSFATVSVNYAIFSLSITSYIVFLLSLNQTPGPEIAFRRAYCTTFGALIALLLHLDVIRPRRSDAVAES
jgi:Fusaric acid resistance protein-like